MQKIEQVLKDQLQLGSCRKSNLNCLVDTDTRLQHQDHETLPYSLYLFTFFIQVF